MIKGLEFVAECEVFHLMEIGHQETCIYLV